MSQNSRIPLNASSSQNRSYNTSNSRSSYYPSVPVRKNAPEIHGTTFYVSFFILIGILLFVFGVSIAAVWSMIEKNKNLDGIHYTKGAHIYSASLDNEINMECENGKVICIEKADQICTGSNWTSNNLAYSDKNYENPDTDPIASGSNIDPDMGEYGAFNIKTTLNLKDSKQFKDCQGKQTCNFNYVIQPFPNSMECKEKTQVISTYTCITEGTKCL